MASLWRGWPISGAALGVLAVILLGNVAASPGVVLAVAAAYVGIGAILFLRAGPARVEVRSMTMVVIAGGADPYEEADRAEWRRLVDMLTRADRMLTTGAISTGAHRAIWWEAYDRLEISD